MIAKIMDKKCLKCLGGISNKTSRLFFVEGEDQSRWKAAFCDRLDERAAYLRSVFGDLILARSDAADRVCLTFFTTLPSRKISN